MKVARRANNQAFTVAEMAIASAVMLSIVALTLSSSVALQKAFSQTDDYLATHIQQIRIMDCLTRDVKRGFSVVTSVDQQTLDVQIPKYIIQAGDPEAQADSSKIGSPRNPTTGLSKDSNIDYVPTRPNGTPSPTAITTNFVRYRFNGSAIERWEHDGRRNVKTTIASSNDIFLPNTINTKLANTEFTCTSINFKPISVADRGGTTIYSTAYLRNRRRTLPTPSPTP